MKRVEILKKEIFLILLIIVEFIIFNINPNIEDVINYVIIMNLLFFISIIGMMLNLIKKEKSEMYGRNMFCYGFMLQYWIFLMLNSIMRHYGTNGYEKIAFTKTLINLMFLIENIVYYFLINKKLVFKILLFILSIIIIFTVYIMLFRSMGDPYSVTPL